MCTIFFLDTLLGIVRSLGSESIPGFGDELNQAIIEVKKGGDCENVVDQALLVKAHRVALLNVKHTLKANRKQHRSALGFEKQVVNLLRDLLKTI